MSNERPQHALPIKYTRATPTARVPFLVLITSNTRVYTFVAQTGLAFITYRNQNPFFLFLPLT